MKFIIESEVLVQVIFEENDDGKVVVPEGVTGLVDALFSENKTIKSIVLPTTLTSIGMEAFRESTIDTVLVTSRQSLEIGALAFCQSSIRKIQICYPLHDIALGESCFAFCDNLEKIELWADIISVGERCFECCINLNSINFCSSTTENKKHTLQIQSYALIHSKVLTLDASEYYNLILLDRIADSKRLKLMISSISSSRYLATDCINEVIVNTLDASENFRTLPNDSVVPLKYVVLKSDVLIAIINNLTVSGLFCFGEREFYVSSFMTLQIRQMILNAILRGQNLDETRVFLSMFSQSKTEKSREFLSSLLDLTIYLHLKGSIATEYRNYEYKLFSVCKSLLIQKSLFTDLSLFTRLIEDGIITEIDCPLIKKYAEALPLREGFDKWYLSGQPLIKLKDFVVDYSDQHFSIYKQGLLFYDGNDVEVQVPSSVMVIRSGAFSNSKSVKKVIIPESVSKIEEKAFTNSSVEEIVCYSKNIIIESHVFDTSTLKRFQFVKVESLTLGEFAFANCQLQQINLPNLTFLPKGCFSNCTRLSSIKLPRSLEVIEESCFRHCVSLSLIEFPLFLNKIGRDAFNECKSLTEVVLPEVSYCMEAFGDTSLTKLEMPSTLRVLSNTTFKVPQEGCIISFKDNRFLDSISVDKICIFQADNLSFPVTLLPLSVLGDNSQRYQHLKEVLFSQELLNPVTILAELLDFFTQFNKESYAKELSAFFIQFYARGLKLSDEIGKFILENKSRLLDRVFLCYPKVLPLLITMYSSNLSDIEQAVVALGEEAVLCEDEEEFEFNSGLF